MKNIEQDKENKYETSNIWCVGIRSRQGTK